MISRLYLFRHGAAAPPGILAGRRDYPLNEQGRRQAAYWREQCAGQAFSAAWCSPLLRARQSAAIILAGNPANVAQADVLPELAEVSLGLWEGLDKERIRARWPEIWEARGRDPAGVAPPQGESLLDLAARVLPVFAALCERTAAHAASLLVAHQAVNRVILARLLDLPPDAWRDIRQPPAALAILELTRGEVRLVEQREPPGC